jgi:hypothetical protein
MMSTGPKNRQCLSEQRMCWINNGRVISSKLIDHVGILSFSRCLRRFSQGRLRWWPRSSETDTVLHPLEAQQLQVLLYNGLPDKACFAEAWRKVDPAIFAQTARAASVSPPR